MLSTASASILLIVTTLTILETMAVPEVSLKTGIAEFPSVQIVQLREKRSPFFKKLWKNRGGDRYQYYNQYNNVYQQGQHPYGPGYHGGGGYNQGNSYANAQAASASFSVGGIQSVFSSASASAGSSNGK